MSELESDYSDHADTLSLKSVNFGSCSLLDQYVGHVRESMGIESHNVRYSFDGNRNLLPWDCEIIVSLYGFEIVVSLYGCFGN